MHINLGNDLLMILLETGHISWDEYAAAVPEVDRPDEYKTVARFMRNRGKVSRRIIKESEWRHKKEKPP